MFKYLIIISSFTFYSIFANTCYSQRCRLLYADKWICSNESEVVAHCNWRYNCFEMETRDYKERDCEGYAYILGEIWDFVTYSHLNFPEGGKLRLENELKGELYGFGNIDLSNNELSMPSDFEIADDISCFVQHCGSACNEQNAATCCFFPMPIGEKKVCGSKLEWVCATISLTSNWPDNRFFVTRSCTRIRTRSDDSQSVSPQAKYRLVSGENSFCEHDGDFKMCYCTWSYCNSY